MSKVTKSLLLLITVIMLCPASALASHISGIRITQTGSTGLMIDVDVTGFYTTGSTETTMYLGTYYNQVPAIDWGDGSTVPRYGLGTSTGIPLVATSTVVNGIPARSYRGSFSHTYGAAGNYTISSNTACCPLTTPTYTLVTGNIMTTTFTTSTPFSTAATVTTSFVQNTLDVVAAAPGFAKVFAPDSVAVGDTSTLTFTIDNTASTLDDDALDFTDNLPAGLVVAAAPNVVNTCTGGTLTAVSGAASINYTGGAVAAGASCTISVDVSPTLAGTLVNTTGDLTSAFGNSGTATDTLTAIGVPLLFSKAFAPSIVGAGVPSTLTFTIDNSANAADASGVDFTDNLPAGMLVATPSNAVNTCTGGTLTAADGSGSITYTGGTVPNAGSCTISADVVTAATGVFVNLSGDLTSAFGNSGTATDTLMVASAPLFTKAFSPDNVINDPLSTLTFTIDNSANTVDATDLNFIDVFPEDMTVAAVPNVVDGCGGVLTAVVGEGDISYMGGTVLAASVCTISVDVAVSTRGNFSNVAGALNSSLGSSGTATATDNLLVSFSEEVPVLSMIGIILLLLVTGLVTFVILRRRQVT